MVTGEPLIPLKMAKPALNRLEFYRIRVRVLFFNYDVLNVLSLAILSISVGVLLYCAVYVQRDLIRVKIECYLLIVVVILPGCSLMITPYINSVIMIYTGWPKKVSHFD